MALGALHVAFTFHDYDSLSMNAVWFAGSGIAIILAGFLNVALIRVNGNDWVIKLLCVIANMTFTLGFAGATFLLSQPQVFLGLILFILATIMSLTIRLEK